MDGLCWSAATDVDVSLYRSPQVGPYCYHGRAHNLKEHPLGWKFGTVLDQASMHCHWITVESAYLCDKAKHNNLGLHFMDI